MASLLLLPLFYFLVITKRTSSHKTKLPPSPPKLPLIGTSTNSVRSLMLSRLSFEEVWPPHASPNWRNPYTYRLLADMALEIMRTHDLIFANRPLLKNAEILLYSCMDMAFSPYGEHWRQLRKLCTLHLLSTKRCNLYQLAREEEVAFMVKNITQCSLLHAPIDMSEVLFSFVNDIHLSVGFRKVP
uniref:Uncharacterized protein n=1 Tax=Ananas comosus var. bracteatus TaxID=296719 RepID=A0A6V7NHX8_ANACO|nr:unnamed protein product [Ananas comosus var. bracteatus]